MADLSQFELTGQKALVTGSAMGIGRSLAMALATAGADVAIVDRDEAQAQKTAAEIIKMGRNCMAVRCDVTDEASVNAAVSAVVSRLGRLDIGVNNAGIYIGGNDEDQSKEEWDKVISVNLTGVWLCAKAEMLAMSKQQPAGGKIINIGSLGAFMACSNGSYDASKAAVKHLTKTLAARWGRYNINVNCISPGYVGRTMAGGDRSDEERQKLRELTPVGYVQRLADLHGPLVFLASRASDFMTGQHLIVDGGHTLSTWMIPLERAVPPRVDAQGERDPA